jgi:hypothetical protein
MMSPLTKHGSICGNVFTELLLRNGLRNPIVALLLDAGNIEMTASFSVARWTVFTELLPGNTSIKSVTLSSGI